MTKTLFLRGVLITLLWLSLLLAPYSLLSYACYAGLCGGQEVSVIKATFSIDYFWIFPLIYPFLVGYCLFQSRQTRKQYGRESFHSIYPLIIPYLLVLPIIYMSMAPVFSTVIPFYLYVIPLVTVLSTILMFPWSDYFKFAWPIYSLVVLGLCLALALLKQAVVSHATDTIMVIGFIWGCASYLAVIIYSVKAQGHF